MEVTDQAQIDCPHTKVPTLTADPKSPSHHRPSVSTKMLSACAARRERCKDVVPLQGGGESIHNSQTNKDKQRQARRWAETLRHAAPPQATPCSAAVQTSRLSPSPERAKNRHQVACTHTCTNPACNTIIHCCLPNSAHGSGAITPQQSSVGLPMTLCSQQAMNHCKLPTSPPLMQAPIHTACAVRAGPCMLSQPSMHGCPSLLHVAHPPARMF